MRGKIYPNIKKWTSIFSIAILGLTVGILLLRLTVFSNPDNGKNGAKNSDDNFAFQMDESITFRDAEDKAKLRMEFPEDSPNIIKIKIARKDEKEVLFESQNIMPGATDTTVTLKDKTLPAGVYQCNVLVTELDQDSFKELEEHVYDLNVEILASVEPEVLDGEDSLDGNDEENPDDSDQPDETEGEGADDTAETE